MKYQLQALCLFVLLNIVFTHATPEEEDKIAEACQKQTEASDDDMKILDDFNELPKTKKQFCLLACMYKGTGTMDANNKLVYEKAVEELEPLKKEDKDAYDKLVKITKECIASTTPDKDQCESVKKYLDCVTKKAKDLGIDA